MIYELSYNLYGSPGIFYITIDATYTANPTDPIVGGTDLMTTLHIADPVKNNPKKLMDWGSGYTLSSAFTVSKSINDLGDKYLFTVGSMGAFSTDNFYGVDRYTITSAGIGSKVELQRADAGLGLTKSEFYASSVKLSPDQHFLAWIKRDPSSSTSSKLWVLPLIHYEPYGDATSISHSGYFGGFEFDDMSTTDSWRRIFFTSSSGLQYAEIQNVYPLTYGSTSTITSSTDYELSDLRIGGNKELITVDENTETLSTVDIHNSNTIGTTALAAKSNGITAFQAFTHGVYRLPKPASVDAFDHNPMAVHVTVNTLCGDATYASNSVAPQFTVTVDPGGNDPVHDYRYNWYPLDGNYADLSDYHSKTPTVSFSNLGGPLVAYFYLTVMDQSHAFEVASRIVKFTFNLDNTWDLAMRDSYDDNFTEPNDMITVDPDNWNIWKSPDVWNRYQADDDAGTLGHENAIYNYGPANQNHAYTRVKNIGCAASPSSGASVELYWTKGAAGEIWPNDWDGDMTMDCANAGMVLINENFGSFTLPAIDPGDEYIHPGGLEWTPPRPGDFDCANMPPADVSNCFLARILTSGSAPYGMGIPEIDPAPVKINILNNNNIVTRNFSTMWFAGKPINQYVDVENSDTVTRKFSLEILPENRLDFMSITMTPDDSLFKLWHTAGDHGDYDSLHVGNKAITFKGINNPFKLDSITLAPGERHKVRLFCILHPDIDPGRYSTPTEEFHFRLLYNDGTETVVDGNYSFSVSVGEPITPKKGGLVVTEISNGPSSNCEYVELLVTNTGSNKATHVDIREWIVDDISGSFNDTSCHSNSSVSQGYYWFSNDSTWNNVPVGAVIVLYNHDANCYNLNGNFTIDTNGDYITYWVPIGGTALSPYGTPHVTRNEPYPSTSSCDYCTTPDTALVASAWSGTVGLNDNADAFQVRCPGCTVTNSEEPSFYHGIGYGGAGGLSIAANATGRGLAYFVGAGTGKKYTFTGNTVADLKDTTKWTKTNADAAGSPPATLGVVSATFGDSIRGHRYTMPNCPGVSQKPGRQEEINKIIRQATNINRQEFEIYPNPTSDKINFQFGKPENARIRLMDLSGKTIAEQTLAEKDKASFNVAEFASGIYLYQVTTDGNVSTGKFTISK